jgi:hypothetical protein
MKISDLLAIELGESVSVANEPFTKIGQAEITLDDGTKMFWLFDDEDHMLSVAPKEDEILYFSQITEEVEPSEVILFQNKEYEFSYEDAGVVKEVNGDARVEEEDRNAFSDYQSKDGEILRIITNENSGEVIGYYGRTVSEEDLSEI